MFGDLVNVLKQHKRTLLIALAVAMIIVLFYLVYRKIRASRTQGTTSDTRVAANTTTIRLATEADIQEAIDSSYDVFFGEMTHADLYARGMTKASTSVSRDAFGELRYQYMQRYKDACSTHDDQEAQLLASLVQRCDEAVSRHLRSITAKDANSIDREMHEKLLALPWKFAKLDDAFEHGYPHTLHDVIFLPSSFLDDDSHDKLCETLLHEKIHVFQRTHPDITARILDHEYMRLDSDATRLPPLRRNNPDLDRQIYQHRSTMCTTVQVYNTMLPKDLADSRIVCLNPNCRQKHHPYEHPYEEMAYVWSSELMK